MFLFGLAKKATIKENERILSGLPFKQSDMLKYIREQVCCSATLVKRTNGA